MDVIIIGAGAAGLMAAKQLSDAGVKVGVLEARERLGGRIYSFNDPSCKIVEGGAEFIHGNLDVTLNVLKEAGLEKQELTGEMWQVKNGKWSRESDFFEHANEVIEKLKLVKEDISIADFLENYFSDERFAELRKSLTSYIEGYYSGEISKASTKSFLEELTSEDEQQYRPEGGYGKMIQHLADIAEKAGAVIRKSTVVKEIRWSEGRVELIDAANNSFTAKKAIITVPLGVWAAVENARGAILYTPALPAKIAAAKQMGFGSVIKVLMQFEEKFYRQEILKKQGDADISGFHFAISDEVIPTWWTQYPNQFSLLTGWLSGPKAEQMKNEPDEVILSKSLDSLINIFNSSIEDLKANVLWSKVFNWAIDPFTLGSYSYSTLQTARARKELSEPVKNTLFFAGEALYDGPEMGTVEAALTSGRDVALKILSL